MKYFPRIYYSFWLVIALLVTFSPEGQAQGRIERIVTGKVERGARAAVSSGKARVRMGANSTKNDLKRSIRKGPGRLDGDETTMDELIEDEEVKDELRDNTEKTRYVKLLGEWTKLPNDAELAARRKKQEIIDSINAQSADEARVTKRIWDDSRDMFIFGWHPYWVGSLYKGYNYSLYNVLSYYSYDINPYTGGTQNQEAVQEFLTGEFVNTVQERNGIALLSVTCHGVDNVTQFLYQNPTAQRAVIDSLVYLIDSVGADGIEINFNGVTSNVKDEFYKFVQILSNTISNVTADTGFVFMSVPPYDKENVYDVSRLQNYVDIFIIKGFDFQETPDGLKKMPVAPYNFSAVSPDYDLRSAVEKYIVNIGPYNTDRLLLALPYYGTRWVTDAITEDVLDMSLMTYSDIQFEYVMKRDDDLNFPGATVGFDSVYSTHVFSYFDFYEGMVDSLGDQPHKVQIYYDDSTSLRKKYQFIQEYRLGGVGIQSLGYDAGFSHLEDVLAEEFTIVDRSVNGSALDQANAKAGGIRQYGIYALVILMYLSIFLSIGFCAALFNRKIRQELFDRGGFRLFYLLFLTSLILLLGYYLGMFEQTTMPLLIGIVVGGLVSWLIWRFVAKRRLFTP